jgi:MFS family permease
MTTIWPGGGTAPGKRRGYWLMAGLLVITMLGGTLPIPLYALWEKQMGFGPLGVTIVFAAYVVGTLFALVLFGDLSDHIGRRRVLALGIGSAAVSTAGFLIVSGVAPSIGLLIAARIVSGLAAGFVTGTATAAIAELHPRGDRQAAAVIAAGSNMTGLGLGPLIAGLFAAYVALPTRSVFWLYLGLCALALLALAGIPETVLDPTAASACAPAWASRRASGQLSWAPASACSPRSASWVSSAAWCPRSCTGSWASATSP